jgi:hypothetical protein
VSRNQKILGALIHLRQILPAKHDIISADALEMYAEALADLPEQKVIDAIAKAAGVCKFFPVPAEIRELAGVKTPADKASAAWDEVFRAIGDSGARWTPVFDDPNIADAIWRIGGWIALCGRDRDWILDWGRKAFLAEYQSVIAYGGPGRPLESLNGRPRGAARAQLPAPQNASQEASEVCSMQAEARAALERLGAGKAYP